MEDHPEGINRAAADHYLLQKRPPLSRRPRLHSILPPNCLSSRFTTEMGMNATMATTTVHRETNRNGRLLLFGKTSHEGCPARMRKDDCCPILPRLKKRIWEERKAGLRLPGQSVQERFTSLRNPNRPQPRSQVQGESLGLITWKRATLRRYPGRWRAERECLVFYKSLYYSILQTIYQKQNISPTSLSVQIGLKLLLLKKKCWNSLFPIPPLPQLIPPNPG
mgnify:FL=1